MSPFFKWVLNKKSYYVISIILVLNTFLQNYLSYERIGLITFYTPLMLLGVVASSFLFTLMGFKIFYYVKYQRN